MSDPLTLFTCQKTREWIHQHVAVGFIELQWRELLIAASPALKGSRYEEQEAVLCQFRRLVHLSSFAVIFPC